MRLPSAFATQIFIPFCVETFRPCLSYAIQLLFKNWMKMLNSWTNKINSYFHSVRFTSFLLTVASGFVWQKLSFHFFLRELLFNYSQINHMTASDPAIWFLHQKLVLVLSPFHRWIWSRVKWRSKFLCDTDFVLQSP